MTFDVWWFLLLPLVFGLGWFAARAEARRGNQERALSTAYAKGLNHLLNERHDEAIDAFIEVVRIDPEKSELHFALGGLFRRRGELERALRVHQSLAERNDLPAAQRDHARFELGQDYLRAGLLDRAEDAFNRLAGSEYARAALAHRLSIAQMVRDWPLAIELAGQLGEDAPTGAAVIAHFHCEQALTLAQGSGAAAEDGQHEPAVAALDKLRQAADAAPGHPRPWVMRGEIALAGGDAQGAIDAWSRLLDDAPDHVSLVAGPWLRAHEQLERADEGIARLEAAYDVHPSVDVLMALHQAWEARDGAGPAAAKLRAAVRAHPGLLGLRHWLRHGAFGGEGEAGTDDRELIDAAIGRQAERLSRFVCRECGFGARRFYWQCPGCSRWDSYTPRRAEEV
ncbi:MAG: lipopolysaccharide assembly protein LapB [Burkholderiaceae bacterium]